MQLTWQSCISAELFCCTPFQKSIGQIDDGSIFTSKFGEAFQMAMVTKIRFSSAYHPSRKEICHASLRMMLSGRGDNTAWPRLYDHRPMVDVQRILNHKLTCCARPSGPASPDYTKPGSPDGIQRPHESHRTDQTPLNG